MPALPWTSSMDPEPDREYLILLSHLPLRRMRTTPRFGRFVQAIRKQLVGTPGLDLFFEISQLLERTVPALARRTRSAWRTGWPPIWRTAAWPS